MGLWCSTSRCSTKRFPSLDHSLALIDGTTAAGGGGGTRPGTWVAHGVIRPTARGPSISLLDAWYLTWRNVIQKFLLLVDDNVAGDGGYIHIHKNTHIHIYTQVSRLLYPSRDCISWMWKDITIRSTFTILLRPWIKSCILDKRGVHPCPADKIIRSGQPALKWLWSHNGVSFWFIYLPACLHNEAVNDAARKKIKCCLLGKSVIWVCL